MGKGGWNNAGNGSETTTSQEKASARIVEKIIRMIENNFKLLR